MTYVLVLVRRPGDRLNTCVTVPEGWLDQYRLRFVNEWGGRVLGVYRRKDRATKAERPRNPPLEKTS